MEKNTPKGLYMGQQSAPGRMSCNRKKLIQTSTFDSRGSFLETLNEKSNCVVCEHLRLILQPPVVSSHTNRANGFVCVSVVAAWLGWGWRKWRGCWRRLNRKKPDWWRVVWVPLNFNCLWNVMSLMNFRTECQLPLLLQQWKFFSHLQRNTDMKDGLLTSSPRVIHILTFSCEIIFSYVPCNLSLWAFANLFFFLQSVSSFHY